MKDSIVISVQDEFLDRADEVGKQFRNMKNIF